MRSKLDTVAGVTLAALGFAVLLANYWDMHIRQVPLSSLSASDWAFDAIVVASSVSAAYVLPLILKAGILALYLALFSDDLIEHSGPTAYLRDVIGPNGTAHDIFFGVLIFLAQTALVLIVGAALLGRSVFRGKLRSEKGRPPARQ